jgi:dienelactone hydrolase
LAVLVCDCTTAAEPEKPQDKNIASAAGQFVDQMAKGEFSAAVRDFDATMKSLVSPDRLKQIWEPLVAQVGPLKSQLSARTERVGAYDCVFVTCQFEKTKLDVKVVFNRSKQISGLFFVPTKAAAKYRPPSYANPSTFVEREVQIGNGEWALPGTLTMPLGDGPFPAVVLVHGSGPNDRDETIGPNKPFCDLACGLASRGVAVLRYEKRTKQHAAKLLALKGDFTVKEETIDDAVAAAALLRHTEKIAPDKVFVLGHSLGGMLVPRIAAQDSAIAGFIIAAGTTRPLEEIIPAQYKYIFSLQGNISEHDKETLRKVESEPARVKALERSPKAASTEQVLGAPASYWLDLHRHPTVETARGMKQPVLVIQGGRDYQATLEDFQGWKDALSSHKNAQFKLYPKLNHLFIEGEGKSTPSEYETPGHVAEAAIKDVAAWIKQPEKKLP